MLVESDFSDAVAELAQLFGWKVAAFRPARTAKGWRTPVRYQAKGWPDLTLVHPDRRLIIFAELKTGSGTTTPEQDDWAVVLRAATYHTTDVRYALWRPGDGDDIARTLSNGKITQWRL